MGLKKHDLPGDALSNYRVTLLSGNPSPESSFYKADISSG